VKRLETSVRMKGQFQANVAMINGNYIIRIFWLAPKCCLYPKCTVLSTILSGTAAHQAHEAPQMVSMPEANQAPPTNQIPLNLDEILRPPWMNPKPFTSRNAPTLVSLLQRPRAIQAPSTSGIAANLASIRQPSPPIRIPVPPNSQIRPNHNSNIRPLLPSQTAPTLVSILQRPRTGQRPSTAQNPSMIQEPVTLPAFTGNYALRNHLWSIHTNFRG